jgi:hypothetical protein
MVYYLYIGRCFEFLADLWNGTAQSVNTNLKSKTLYVDGMIISKLIAAKEETEKRKKLNRRKYFMGPL